MMYFKWWQWSAQWLPGKINKSQLGKSLHPELQLNEAVKYVGFSKRKEKSSAIVASVLKGNAFPFTIGQIKETISRWVYYQNIKNVQACNEATWMCYLHIQSSHLNKNISTVTQRDQCTNGHEEMTFRGKNILTWLVIREILTKLLKIVILCIDSCRVYS